MTAGIVLLILTSKFLKKIIENKGKVFTQSRNKSIFIIEQTFTFIKDIIILGKKKYFQKIFERSLDPGASLVSQDYMGLLCV